MLNDKITVFLTDGEADIFEDATSEPGVMDVYVRHGDLMIVRKFEYGEVVLSAYAKETWKTVKRS